jgi:hypothetical protein
MSQPPHPPRGPRKRTIVAVVLTFLLPGLGQIYNGERAKGAAILVATLVLGTLAYLWMPAVTPDMAPEDLDLAQAGKFLAVGALVFAVGVVAVVDAGLRARR